MTRARPVDEGTRRPRVTRRENLVTALLASVIGAGTTLDVWAHGRFGDDLETFFTPWHGLEYSGLLLTAAWIGLLVMRRQERGASRLASIPAGYGLGLAGAAVMAAAGLADLAWHTAFGIEVGLEALVSPPHMLLVVGEMLLVSTPLRAAMADSTLGEAPTFAASFPAVLSVGLATWYVALPILYLSPLLIPATDAASAIPGMVTTTLLLVGPLLLMLRGWRLPFGSATTLFGLHALAFAAVGGFAFWPAVLPVLAAGLAADMVVRLARHPSRRSPATYAVAGLPTLVLWSTYILLLWVLGAMDWPVALWTGVIAVATGAGVALATLMASRRSDDLDPLTE
ncbi:MAG: hypothetical protein ACRDZO_22310 [Egibacteraceae bacterium]